MLNCPGLPETTPYLYWECNNAWGGHYVQALRQGDWKLLRFRTPERQWDELYDRDVAEYQDLAGRYPDVVARLAALMDRARTEPDLDRFKIPY